MLYNMLITKYWKCILGFDCAGKVVGKQQMLKYGATGCKLPWLYTVKSNIGLVQEPWDCSNSAIPSKNAVSADIEHSRCFH